MKFGGKGLCCHVSPRSVERYRYWSTISAHTTKEEGALSWALAGSAIRPGGLVRTPVTGSEVGTGVGSGLAVAVGVVAATGGGWLRACRASTRRLTVANTRNTAATAASAGRKLEAGLASASAD